MSSNRLVFLFLGIIFLVIIILSSSRIASTLRGWFGKYIPPSFQGITLSITPIVTAIPTKIAQAPSPTLIPKNEGNVIGTTKGTPSTQIPATGPQEVVWFLVGASATGAIVLRKLEKVISLKKN